MDAGPWFSLAKKQTLLLLIRHPFKFKTKLNLDFFFEQNFQIFFWVKTIRKFQKRNLKKKEGWSLLLLFSLYKVYSGLKGWFGLILLCT